MRRVRIIRGQTERGTATARNPKPGYRWVVAWRVVDADTRADLAQPYFDRMQGGKKAARAFVRAHGYTLVEVER